jgi:hypothetical protein
LLVSHANASALGTLVEHTTRFTLLVPLKAKDAATVRRTLPAQLRRSLTYDQGPEMREHRLYTKQTKMRVYARILNAHSNYSQRLSSLAERKCSQTRSTPVGSMNLAVRVLRRAGFPFLFHEVHRRTHFELDKDSTPSSPEFGPCRRGWRCRRRLIQLGKLDLDIHDRHRWGWGIGDVWPEGYSE